MRNFCVKLGRFFWSWGFLKFILWTATLVIFFYVEEDWRGARTWATTKAEWEAKGESFDPNKFIPPPVPDDQNLAALPLFKMEPVKDADGSSFPEPVALQRATRTGLPGNDLPPTGNWMRGEQPDMVKIRSAIALDYAKAFKGVAPPVDTLAQLEALYPFLADLRASAVDRPLFRLSQDYAFSPPAGRPLGIVVEQIKLSKILTLHAVLALDQHQPDLALSDIKLNYEILSGVRQDPTFVAGLVALGMNAIVGTAIRVGLATHAWSDSQLAELEQTLRPIDFLAEYQFAMRSEAVESIANLDYFEKRGRRTELLSLFGRGDSGTPATIKFAPPWPRGWWDNNKSLMATFLFQELSTVDPSSHRVFRTHDLDLQHENEVAQAQSDAMAPWNIWFIIASGPLYQATQSFAYGQVWVDETRIACALERYRLAHGGYPDSLDALSPTYLDAVPHDIINGEPYHYRIQADGMFLVYSIGWNEKDDGGKIVSMPGNPKVINKSDGDWVWPAPQPAVKK